MHKEKETNFLSPHFVLETAEKLKKEGKYKEAASLLEEALKKFKNYIPIMVSLAKSYIKINKKEDAIRLFNEVLRIDKENIVAIKELAYLYEEKGDYLEAIKKYKFLRVFFSKDEELKRKIEELEILANPPLSPKEKKILKFKKILSKIEKR